MAEQAGWSRVLAGLQYPSDYYAGLALGRKVAEQVIAKAKADGSDAVWTGTVPTGPCNWIGVNPGNVTAPTWRPLLLTLAKRVPARSSAGVRLTAGDRRDNDGAHISTDLRHELQSVLLAKSRGYQHLALPVRGQVDFRRRAGPESTSGRAGVRADRSCPVRRIHCQPGREIRVLVHPAAATRSGDHTVVPDSELPELSVEPLDVFGRPVGDARLPISGARRLYSRASRRKPGSQESGPAFTFRWTTLRACSSGNRSRRFSSTGRRATVRSSCRKRALLAQGEKCGSGVLAWIAEGPVTIQWPAFLSPEKLRGPRRPAGHDNRGKVH